MTFARRILSASIGVVAFSMPLHAQETQSQPAENTQVSDTLSIQLNSVVPSERGCRVSFVTKNGLGKTIDLVSFEMALFNTQGVLERIVNLDFKELTPEKTKVLQFDIPNMQCENLGQVLINDVPKCAGADLDRSACLKAVKTDTRADVIFGL